MDSWIIQTLLEVSCFFNLILIGSVILITRALEARELENKALKRKIQSAKDILRKL